MTAAKPLEAPWGFAEVVAFLGMSKSWVRHATADGTLPSFHIGRRVFYEPERIRSWLEAQRKSTSAQVLHLLPAPGEKHG